jgi:hypothetical protein
MITIIRKVLTLFSIIGKKVSLSQEMIFEEYKVVVSEMKSLPIKWISVICPIILNLTACKNNGTFELEKLLPKWIGKTVLFPNIEPVRIDYSDSLNYISEFI